MEIEAKFEIIDPKSADFSAILSRIFAAGYRVEPPDSDIHMIDSYFDTAAFLLAQHDAALRIREVDQRRLLTYKRKLRQQGNLLSRMELEAEPEPNHLHTIQTELNSLGLHSNSTRSINLNDWLDGFGLKLIVSLDSTRTKAILPLATRGAAELSYDRMLYSNGENREELIVLEIEAIPPAREEEIQPISRLLQAALGNAIRPQTKSKVSIAIEALALRPIMPGTGANQ